MNWWTTGKWGASFSVVLGHLFPSPLGFCWDWALGSTQVLRLYHSHLGWQFTSHFPGRAGCKAEARGERGILLPFLSLQYIFVLTPVFLDICALSISWWKPPRCILYLCFCIMFPWRKMMQTASHKAWEKAAELDKESHRSEPFMMWMLSYASFWMLVSDPGMTHNTHSWAKITEK